MNNSDGKSRDKIEWRPRHFGIIEAIFDGILGIRALFLLYTGLLSNPFPGHQRLWKRGILHRDISWGNVLCLTEDDRDIDMAKQPCIEQLL